MKSEITSYETTREMLKAHDLWFNKLDPNKPAPPKEVYRVLCEIRESYIQMMEELRFGDGSVGAIENELTDMAEALCMFQRFQPMIRNEVRRISSVIQNHFGQERSFDVDMNLNSFVDLDNLSFSLLQPSEQYKRIQFVSSDPAQRYSDSFPSDFLGMDNEYIIKNLRKH